MKILTANEQVAIRQRHGYRRFIEDEMMLRWGARVDWTTRGTPLRAWVNASSWVVNCPYCRGALVAEPGEPFFCPDCGMQGNGGHAQPVMFPARRAEIEAVLLRRPDPTRRNWLLTESVMDLVRENAAHGIGG